MSLSHPLNLYHLSLNSPVTCPDVKPIPSLKVLSKILHTLHYPWIVLLDFDIRFHCCSHCFLLALTGGKAAFVASSRRAGDIVSYRLQFCRALPILFRRPASYHGLILSNTARLPSAVD